MKLLTIIMIVLFTLSSCFFVVEGRKDNNWGHSRVHKHKRMVIHTPHLIIVKRGHYHYH